ncbi:MAG TPA: DUF3606 domain-containing protein [Burkholderiales bacterium]|jgi:hypothetical protein|nr:DUF3606 domain-containing protein [Burkholderiales bacterium]
MKLDTKNYAPPDPAKIDADNPEALRFWAGTLETNEDRLRQAVRKVGPMLEQVKQELGIGGPG